MTSEGAGLEDRVLRVPAPVPVLGLEPLEIARDAYDERVRERVEIVDQGGGGSTWGAFPKCMQTGNGNRTGVSLRSGIAFF